MTAPSAAAAAFASGWTPLVARLVREFGDLALAEDAASEAFAAAAEQWRAGVVPDRPDAWLLVVGRRRCVDALRRRGRLADRTAVLAGPAASDDAPDGVDDPVRDQLALLFGCCHPALAPEHQVALTLRAVNGLSTAQIARAFLVPPDTMARRLHRARERVRTAGVPFRVPPPDRWAERLDAVLTTVYLVLTAGHTATEDVALVRGDLCDEAAWLSGLLVRLLPDDAEVAGLAALVCLTDARRAARVDAAGGLVLLQDQDRTRWDAELLADGRRHLARARRQRRLGPFQLQATIAACHAAAPTWQATDWTTITRCYDALALLDPSPVVALNRAVAVSMASGPDAALPLVEELVAGGTLDAYPYLWATRADLLRRLDDHAAARDDYARALARSTNATERAFLATRRDAARVAAADAGTSGSGRTDGRRA